MSTIQKISQLSHRIFNTSATEKTVARQSNPFAASNFQKNVLTMDTFESASKVGADNGIVARSKRMYATFVGSINDFGTNVCDTFRSICSSVKNYALDKWNRISEIGNTEITMSGIKNILAKDVLSLFGHSREREVLRISKMDPHTEVKPMLQEAISALEHEMAQAA